MVARGRKRSGRREDMWDGCKVFSATMAKDRESLGEKVTDWVRSKRGVLKVVDKVVSQSSDNEFHCLSITVFYADLS